MKPTLVLLLMATMCCADTITNRFGVVLGNVQVIRAEPDALVVMASNGVRRIPFADLSDDIKLRYGFDAAKAAEFDKNRKVAIAETRIRNQKATESRPTNEQVLFRESEDLTRKALYDNDYRKATNLGFSDNVFRGDRVKCYRRWKERGSKREELPAPP